MANDRRMSVKPTGASRSIPSVPRRSRSRSTVTAMSLTAIPEGGDSSAGRFVTIAGRGVVGHWPHERPNAAVACVGGPRRRRTPARGRCRPDVGDPPRRTLRGLQRRRYRRLPGRAADHDHLPALPAGRSRDRPQPAAQPGRLAADRHRPLLGAGGRRDRLRRLGVQGASGADPGRRGRGVGQPVGVGARRRDHRRVPAAGLPGRAPTEPALAMGGLRLRVRRRGQHARLAAAGADAGYGVPRPRQPVRDRGA